MEKERGIYKIVRKQPISRKRVKGKKIRGSQGMIFLPKEMIGKRVKIITIIRGYKKKKCKQ